jgi:hypothetical protein
MTMVASKDDNKRKYSANGAEEEVEEALPKKQKTINDNYNGDDHGDDKGDDDGDSSSSSSSTDDDSSSELEEVYSKEDMNILSSSEEKLLIR